MRSLVDFPLVPVSKFFFEIHQRAKRIKKGDVNISAQNAHTHAHTGHARSNFRQIQTVITTILLFNAL